MAQLIKPQIKWTQDKIDLLKKEYPLGDKKKLCEIFGIKYKTLKCAARTFGVRSERDTNFYKLKPLYENSNLAFYWMGFIMADGHIHKKKELVIGLSNKDKIHIEKLASFLNIKTHEFTINRNNVPLYYTRLSCSDAFYAPKICEKFDLQTNKTYSPPKNIDFPSNDLFLSFIIGLIDGDGTFSKDKTKKKCSFIRIELHENWLAFLNVLASQLVSSGVENPRVSLNARKFSQLRIYRQKNFEFLKNFAIKNNLPILERKWEIIQVS